MRLIADSGSTKTQWLLDTCNKVIETQGINPVVMSEQSINESIINEVLPQFQSSSITEIFFYGAGCIPPHTEKIHNILVGHFKSAQIQIYTDMLGAARALLGHKPGVACILGTGANSCFYDGQSITDNIPPLGYILGDEGSGAYLGKRFLGDALKRLLPEDLFTEFCNEYQLSYPEIIRKIYQDKHPNRFLASIAPFLHRNRNNESIHQLLLKCFDEFICRNLLKYPTGYPVAIVGSVGYYFQDEIREVARKYSLQIEQFIQQPIHALKHYHTDN